MSGATKIPWADKVWNPVTGCSRVSDGCKNCYAHAMHARFGKGPFKVTFHEDRRFEPTRWKKPSRIFVCSMSDIFHPDVETGMIVDIMETVRECPQHTFMFLTKRPERLREPQIALPGDRTWPLGDLFNEPNVWLGVSVENQATADERIPILLRTPAAVRFVSCEPLLGPINFPRYFLGHNAMCDCSRSLRELNGLAAIEPDCLIHKGCPQCGKEWTKFTGLNWCIVGAESGHAGARPCDPSWVRSIIGQCEAAGVPLFVKQWRENGRLVKMPRIDDKVYNQFPEIIK